MYYVSITLSIAHVQCAPRVRYKTPVTYCCPVRVCYISYFGGAGAMCTVSLSYHTVVNHPGQQAWPRLRNYRLSYHNSGPLYHNSVLGPGIITVSPLDLPLVHPLIFTRGEKVFCRVGNVHLVLLIYFGKACTA